MDFKIGDRVRCVNDTVVAVGNYAPLQLIKGRDYIVYGISHSGCSCRDLLLDVGIVDPPSKSAVCMRGHSYAVSGTVGYRAAKRFVKITETVEEKTTSVSAIKLTEQLQICEN